MKKLKCHFCLNYFNSKRVDAKFCSSRCRVATSRKRNNSVTDNKDRVILSLCDLSGVWSDPYRLAGYTVLQIDLQSGQDIRLLERIDSAWGILAAPPCTVFSLAGNRSWSAGRRSESDLLEALSIVDACLRQVTILQPEWWALENPRGRISKYLGKPRWEFQPYEYGDKWSKRTCLWGKFNIPTLKKVVVPEFSLTEKYRDPNQRSTTPPGFAQAFFEANR